MRRIFLLAGLVILAGTNGSPAGEPSRFALNDGDRIVLVGDTLIERDQRYGYLETLLTLSHPGKNVTFRNLGWSGDTVAGLSRAGFDPPEAGYRQLIQQVLAAKPTVLIVGYGMAESFDGGAALPRFVAGLNRFLDAVSSTKARVVLLSPIAHANLGPPWPDPSAHNESLARYSRAIAEVAKARGAWFIDLFEPSKRREAERAAPPITDDGVVLNEAGYRYLAVVIARGLDPSASVGWAVPRIELTASGAVGPVSGAKVAGVERVGDGLRFRLTREALAVPGDALSARWIDPAIMLTVSGLAEGRYELRADGRRLPIDARPAADWARGMRISGGPDVEQMEGLRATINRKNRLFFHRWRPQNITYLFGFRKHEQGRNAVEIPQFDPLVAEQEARIAGLRRPEAHDYELVRAVASAER